MAGRTVSMLEGSTFVVGDERGDLEATPAEAQGLFDADTRHLSRWVLTVGGQRLNMLSTDDLTYFSSQFFLVPGTGTVYVDADISVLRKRKVGHGFHEDLVLQNHRAIPVDIDVRIDAASDFADLFEVKDALRKKGELYSRVDDHQLVLGYRRERFVRETRISTSAPARFDERGISFRVHIEPHGEWKTCIDVVAANQDGKGKQPGVTYDHDDEQAIDKQGVSLVEWVDKAPALSCSWRSLEQTYERSVIDLAALRYHPLLAPEDSLPAAGLPWFMAVFGRDSLMTAFQALPFHPELAETTLRVLGLRQGTTIDEFRDEEPGKILHESRAGELTAFEERPHSPYFGSADATPLFVILLDEYERWTGKSQIVRDFEYQARAALDWMDKYGDRDDDGYVEYDRRNKETGLENQCWKDSWNSILFADGTLAPLPRATCEIQGYVYDAKVRAARLAREFWQDPELAARLEREASDLKERFNRDFWLADRGYYALALDGQKRPVDSLTSNIGHLLWSGIVDQDKAEPCVRHLLGPRLFSGWGVRTMAEGDGGYNPVGYHVGTVWPHDNSFIALGLMRYGYRDEATEVAMGMLEAATYFRGRLPEAFAGYPRAQTHYPVEYPTACSPQAWASGTPLLMLRVLLGLEPLGEHLIVEPHLPQQIAQLALTDVPGRWGRRDAFARGTSEGAMKRQVPRAA